MATIRINKEFGFEMAHALLGYNGKCSNIHGHSYKLTVTLIGSTIDNLKDPKNGMVMDFGELKNIVNNEIINVFDHALVLNDATPDKENISSMPVFEKVIFLPYQPTCENMLIDFASRISKCLSSGIKLHSLKLRETDNSFAEWFAEDN
ncbi:MAG: 6-carboxytetrahydropterin synthase [Bacteroidetes bacterium]|nr:6-carboxytetrahydropterin synthase [Bacteroidota bacterium]